MTTEQARESSGCDLSRAARSGSGKEFRADLDHLPEAAMVLAINGTILRVN
jgi:hypothetical protein